MHMIKITNFLSFFVLLSLLGCSVAQEADSLLNLFPVEQDVTLGQQVSQQIALLHANQRLSRFQFSQLQHLVD